MMTFGRILAVAALAGCMGFIAGSTMALYAVAGVVVWPGL